MRFQRIILAAFIALTMLTANLSVANADERKFTLVVVDPITGGVWQYSLQREENFVELSTKYVLPGFFVITDGKDSTQMLKRVEARIEKMRRETGGWMYVFVQTDKNSLSKRVIEAAEKILTLDKACVFEADRRYIEKASK